MNDTAQQPEVITQVDPNTVLMDNNIRSLTEADKDLIAGVAEVGVLQPVTLVASPDGLRVRYGHRRTLAAIAAGRMLPSIIREATEDDAGRIVEQWHENEYREGLTVADQAAAVEQLALLGTSARQIAKRLHLSPNAVEAARAVSGNDTARDALGAMPAMTIAQAAVIAEFADAGNNEAVEVLLSTAARNPGTFDHQAQRLRDDAATEARQTEARASIAATGVAVLDDAPGYDSPIQRLTALTTDAGEPLTPGEHASCPGHVAWLATSYGWFTVAQALDIQIGDERNGQTIEGDLDDGDPSDYDGEDYDGDPETLAVADDTAEDTTYRARYAATYGCQDPAGNGHLSRYKTTTATQGSTGEDDVTAAKEAARVDRRRTIENNRDWKAATEVRRDWVKTYLTRKTPAKGTLAYLARETANGRHALAQAMHDGHGLACEWFGITSTTAYYNGNASGLLSLLDTASDGRTQVITLGLFLAAYENATTGNDWRSKGLGSTKPYLLHLADLGYPLSNVERIAADLKPIKAKD